MTKAQPVLESLKETIPAIFDQAQSSSANHRKNCTTLHKLHLQAVSVRQPAQNGSTIKLIGERTFCDMFIDMVSRVLVVKKGCLAADRIVKFIGSYVQFILQKAAQLKEHQRKSDAREDDIPAVRFTFCLLKWLLQGFNAKGKTVRFRTVSLATELISHLNEIDEDAYSNIRQCLVERAYDKEATIRGYAVIALSKIIGGEDPSELPADQPSIVEILLDHLQFDDSAEVRRCALLHVPLTPRTVPAVLTRSRDVDPNVRKLLFSTILSMGGSSSKSKSRRYQSSSKFEHPRQLTLAQREKVIRDGLGDREEAVRVAASQAVAAWHDIVSGEEETESPLDGIIAFVKLFDVVSPEGIEIAVDALKALLLTNSGVFEHIILDAAFWQTLSPESIFIARVFIAYCHESEPEARLEAAKIPVVTALSFYLQESCNDLLDAIEELEDTRLQADTRPEDAADEDDEAIERKEDVVTDRAFIVSEMLRLIATCDFSDEIGRRKAFAVVREMLAHELLPETLTEPCMDVLKLSSSSERELIRVVVEMIAELRDGEELQDASNIFPDGSSSLNTTQSSQRSRSLRRTKTLLEMSPEEREKADAVDLRCLGICTAMLSRIQSSFDENSTLEGLLADLIIPAVKRKELALRERGLVNLGLCCLIAKSMAMNSLQLFLNQVQSAPEDLKVKVLQVVFDILMIYDEELLLRSEDIAHKIVTFLLQTLEIEESPAVQAVLCVGISKLMLAGLVTDPRVLTSMLMAYVSPMTADNQELRQCLSYFLTVYCYCSAVNQQRLQSVAMTAYDLVRQVNGEVNLDEQMISPYQFGLLLVDWMDSQKLINADRQNPSMNEVQLDFAMDLLKALYGKDRTDEDRKDLCQLLGKLHISDSAGDFSLFLLHILLSDLEDHCPFEDSASEKLLEKFRAGFTKRFGRRIERIDAHKHSENGRFRELCAFIGIELEDACVDKDLNVNDAEKNADVFEGEGKGGSSKTQAVPARQDKGKGREIVAGSLECPKEAKETRT
ncbi:hypothetical protein DAEQUDRAFT_768182 [Daedalea quercina L-15889]|uniref:Nuclear condensin complex subunit 3 C-terminal domain-containing protein n=1 Tax=Daedalea quercina L-15889 TaxID=1314783 RepID=A0A165MY02_9APHY|nr:hypothetical protein DAEQUDRAFT_768182 [Daedalea quercina L-15889]